MAGGWHLYRGSIGLFLAVAVFTACADWRPLSIEQLTARAQLIVRGTVTSRTCQRDGAGQIYTTVDFQVAEVWKGSFPGTNLAVVHSGGVLGDEQAACPQEVDLPPGEEAVLFLILNPAGQAVCVGMAQGKFRLISDGNGDKLAVNPFHGRQPLQSKAGSIPQLQAPLTVSELKRRVCSNSK